MCMSIEQKRAEVAAMYPWRGWKDKVAKMSEDQVRAIYQRLLEKARR